MHVSPQVFTMELCLFFLSYLTLIVNGVFGDEVKSVSVMEGENVTLHTDVVKQRDDLIVWTYGPENTLVVRINGEANSIMYSDDERFKDKLKMNDQTGDLIITHITSQHSGLYALRIYSNMKLSYKKFNLTVNGHFLPLDHITKPTQDLDNTQLCEECSESPDQRLIVITAVSCTAVLCVIFIISIIIYMKKRMVPVNSSKSENHLTVEMRKINSSSSCEDKEALKCLNETQHWSTLFTNTQIKHKHFIK
ncbi:uncharacterized protein LOC130429513 isoform X5 [Triplophysa dalaica]|uniref:uncharacterized protein LOC130429513 isoform X5 n=1 Tax=Triplophysa dalaica TaxID=1582913 RepID=UPI0024DFD54B|nr:uncharacterized protein LOC130429513 isoform X5 [Triplophysa dalaica]